ncbi:MAG: hypothetical protein ABIP93_11755 [Gemmatimonadaceae bacterium]
MTSLWNSSSIVPWATALERYDHVVSRQEVTRLAELDRWYRDDLPVAIEARTRPHVTLPELVRLAEWKMARGVWRAPNLVLVRSNPADEVIETSTRALAMVPHLTAPIAALAGLKGVGPATASAVTASAAPAIYPFFDELVAEQVPSLGKVAWTLGFYGRYAAALRARAVALGSDWTPVMVERALWSWVGGKKGAR